MENQAKDFPVPLGNRVSVREIAPAFQPFMSGDAEFRLQEDPTTSTVPIMCLQRSRRSRAPLGLAAFLVLIGLPGLSFAQPGVTRPAPGAGSGARTPPRTTPAPPTPGAARPATTASEANPAELPKDFVPPRKVPEIMTIEKELMTEQEEKDIQKELVKEKFATALRAGELSDPVRKLLKKGASWSVRRLSMKSYRDQLPDMRDKLVREVNAAGKLQTELSQQRAFRVFYMKEITDRASELLDGNYQVRMNAVILLGELTIGDADPKKNIPEEPYTEALVPLLKVLDDKTQPDAIKICALRGLARIIQNGKPTTEQKLLISTSLVNELKRRDTHWWYQMRLAEALGGVDVVLDRGRIPFVAQVLMESLVDNSRHCVVRTEAARSLGRIPLDGDVNASLIAFEVAHLAQQLAAEYNRKPNGAFWKDCYLKLYFAFRPVDAAAKTRGDGLMTKVEKSAQAKHKGTVNEAYQQTLNLVNHVFLDKTNSQIPDTLVTPVTDWLKKNQPADDRLAPNLPTHRIASPPTETKPPAG